MGLFDIFGGGTPAEKAQRLKKKVTEKYGDAAARQKAIADLVKLESPDTVPVLMALYSTETSTSPATGSASSRVSTLRLRGLLKTTACACMLSVYIDG
jgi:hypothetical protein